MEITEERLQQLNKYCDEVLKVRFNNIELLEQAFTHKSCNLNYNNERLEFLGDAILELVTVDFIFREVQNRPEGELSKIKSAAVNENTLYNISKTLKISEMMNLGKGEENAGGRNTKSLLADCIEALIGAYYVDCKNYEQTRTFVESFVVQEIKAIEENKGYIDYKSILQEYCQKELHGIPKYETVRKTGPDHASIFWESVSIPGKPTRPVFGPACGKSKKAAQQACAKIVCDRLGLKNKELS